MQRDDQVIALRQPVAGGCVEGVDPLAHRDERIDHGVSDIVDLRLVSAFCEQVLARLGRMDEQQVRNRIGENAIYLLGHRAIERAQAGLHVGDLHTELDGDQRGRERRVDVAGNQHHVGPLRDYDGLQALHYRRGLLSVRP